MLVNLGFMSTKILEAARALTKKFRDEAETLARAGDGSIDVGRAQGLRQAADELDALVRPHAFVAQEVAYRKPGEGWKRTICKSVAAFDKKLAQLSEQGAEVQTRDA
jgi:hypothetical protein